MRRWRGVVAFLGVPTVDRRIVDRLALPDVLDRLHVRNGAGSGLIGYADAFEVGPTRAVVVRGAVADSVAPFIADRLVVPAIDVADAEPITQDALGFFHVSGRLAGITLGLAVTAAWPGVSIELED